MKESAIPIQNIYSMLCYAWGHLSESKEVRIGGSEFRNSSDFFARTLIAACDAIFKRGIRAEYELHTEETASPRGKYNLSASLKMGSLQKGKLVCEFDLFTIDNDLNRILKCALTRLLRSGDLDKLLRRDLAERVTRFSDVTDVAVDIKIFQRLKFNRNNQLYRLAINLCHFFFESLIPDQSQPGGFRVMDFWKEERAMARLFEAFLRNFYRQEQVAFPTVGGEVLDWDAVSLVVGGEDFLPVMRTDISMSNEQRHLIIDAKFYAQIFESRTGNNPKIRSSNLYQLTSYLRSKSSQCPQKQLEGLLIYPSVGENVRLTYKFQMGKVSIATVNLAADWSSIRSELLSLLE